MTMASERTLLLTVPEHRETVRRRRRLQASVVAISCVLGIWSVVSVYVSQPTPSTSSEQGDRAHDSAGRHSDDEFFCGINSTEFGYVKLPHKRDDNAFYWYVAAETNASAAPLVLWLQGGPGASSMEGLLTENGPCLLQQDAQSFRRNEFAWSRVAHMVWLDQPTGVGYSYSTQPEADADSTSADAAATIYWFLQTFLAQHPELQGREVFLAGESYAGHYIPAAARLIQQRNDATTVVTAPLLQGVEEQHIDLRGIIIGNGWVNPLIQHAHMLDIIHNEYNVPLANDSLASQLRDQLQTCDDLTRQCTSTKNATACLQAETCLMDDVIARMEANAQRNRYNVRVKCQATGACDQTPNMSIFMNSNEVRRHLPTSAPTWQAVNKQVMNSFSAAGDWSSATDSLISDVLSSNDTDVRVLIYNGDADLLVNVNGTQAWIENMAWSRQHSFELVPETSWILGNTSGGSVRSLGPLTFVRVHKAGHMVPRDQPELALDVFHRFVTNKPFQIS